MATTKIADVVVPEQMASMANAEILKSLDFLKTGLAVKDYNNVDIREHGHFAEVPFYNELTGDDEVITDSASLTPDKITTGKDIGVVCHRGKAWGGRQLAAIVSGDDPMKEISRQVGTYWSKRIRTAIINTLNGVLNGTNGVLKDTHASRVGVTTGTKVLLSHQTALTAMNLIGDAMDDFEVMVVHSKVFTDMINAQLVSFPYDTDPQRVKIKTWKKYLECDVIVSDDVPVDAGVPLYKKYTTYFGKKGSIYLGMQRELMSETDRDSLAFEDILATQVHFVPHLKLVKWGVTTQNPTNAQLATGTNWTKVAANDKLIKFVALETN
jgi:hypothetical protein